MKMNENSTTDPEQHEIETTGVRKSIFIGMLCFVPFFKIVFIAKITSQSILSFSCSYNECGLKLSSFKKIIKNNK